MLHDFRAIYFPYVLKRQTDGRHAVLNRNQKPVGFATDEYIRFEDFPVTVRFKNLTPAKAARISCYGFADPDDIQLYDDGCHPFSSTRDMNDYLRRYAMLLELKIETH